MINGWVSRWELPSLHNVFRIELNFILSLFEGGEGAAVSGGRGGIGSELDPKQRDTNSWHLHSPPAPDKS